MTHHLLDFPPGPLDKYRARASFDWKQMKLFLDTKEIIEFENRLLQELKKHPSLFKQRPETLNEIRRISAKKTFILSRIDEKFFHGKYTFTQQRLAYTYIMFQIDPSVVLRYRLMFAMFCNAVSSLGTERHRHLLESALKGDIVGCFCLTEEAHGSNAKGMKTTATYDPTTKEFIIHTPKPEDTKCWAGILGQMATHAVVYANLITPNGLNHGLHAFVVNIRDSKTLKTLPNIIIGDLGEKLGLNGIDNGRITFDHCRIPRENLLNKAGDVTVDGRYLPTYKDPNKRHGVNLGVLSEDRFNIIPISTSYLMKAITIAIRYAAVRRQFGENDQEEQSILEYQSHQHRLFPYLALTYALKIFSSYIFEIYQNFCELSLAGKVTTQTGSEIHAISAATKPYCAWIVRDAIQECREACGGHGYLQVSGFGDLRNDHDPNCTHVGEGHVLIQQTGNWLLKFWPLILSGKIIKTPYKSVYFLNKAQEILKEKFSASSLEEMMDDPKCILSTYQWLVCYLLKACHEKYNGLLKTAPHYTSDKAFFARNNSQVYFIKTLCIVYIQHFILQTMYIKIIKTSCVRLRKVLLKLFSLLGCWNLEKHIPILYMGGYVTDQNVTSLIQESILTLCEDLKDDAVALIDVIAKPDFITNSPLGCADGQVYEHLKRSMLEENKVPPRPSWWKDVINWKDELQNKL